MEPLLDIRSLSVTFGGVAALSDVSLGVTHGSVHGLIGPNGAGKTTLLNCISRLIEPDAGAIRYAGSDLLATGADRIAALGITRSFQNLGLIAQLSVLDNVKVGLHTRHRGTLIDELLLITRRNRHEREVARKAMEALRLAGLAAHADRPIGSLSYGMRKSVEFARAVAAEPRLLLLDEPTAGLSALEMNDLRDRLATLRRTTPITILVITHHLEFLAQVADMVTVLDLGRVIASGSAAEVNNDPAVIEAYIGAARAHH